MSLDAYKGSIGSEDIRRHQGVLFPLDLLQIDAAILPAASAQCHQTWNRAQAVVNRRVSQRHSSPQEIARTVLKKIQSPSVVSIAAVLRTAGLSSRSLIVGPFLSQTFQLEEFIRKEMEWIGRLIGELSADALQEYVSVFDIEQLDALNVHLSQASPEQPINSLLVSRLLEDAGFKTLTRQKSFNVPGRRYVWRFLRGRKKNLGFLDRIENLRLSWDAVSDQVAVVLQTINLGDFPKTVMFRSAWSEYAALDSDQMNNICARVNDADVVHSGSAEYSQ